MLTICLYGLAGSGKSTAAAQLKKLLAECGYTVDIIKIAAPLYRLQGEIYRTAGREIGEWEHDNELLRSLAVHLRRINPRFLVDNFLDRVKGSRAQVVINDDMRKEGGTVRGYLKILSPADLPPRGLRPRRKRRRAPR